MSTKKSRQVRGNKSIQEKDIQDIFDSDDEKKETLTEEQKEINKKLSESGFLEEGLNWDEKKDIFKTLSASVSSAKYENQVRGSPKSDSKEKIIPIEIEDQSEREVLEKGEVAYTRQFDSEPKKNTKNGNSFLSKLTNYIGLGSSKKGNEEDSQGNIKCNKSENLVSDSKCNKLNVDHKRNENNAIDLISSDEDSESVFVPKKRPSPPEVETTDHVKKLKMDQSNTKQNVSNLRKPLKSEMEWATKQNSICFNRRSNQTILNELQKMNRLRKEASTKYKFPVRWGQPIVRNSNERWDGQTIPQKLIDRYQKFLSKNCLEDSNENLKSFHIGQIDKLGTSTSSPEDKEEKVEVVQSIEETAEQAREKSEKVPRQYERKAKGRNLYNPAVSESDDFESIQVDVDEDDGGEWLPKEVARKNEKSTKPLKNSNMKNVTDSSGRRAIVKLKKVDNKAENYKFFKSKNPDEDTDGNGEGSQGDWSNIEAQESSNFNDENLEESSGVGDYEQVPCPICNKSFKKNLIEHHATECASKHFQD